MNTTRPVRPRTAPRPAHQRAALRSTPAALGPERVLRATVEYDGSRFRGWQTQVNARTVQGALLGALREMLGPEVRLHGAGRTDAGVHALAQVASVHFPARTTRIGASELLRDWNDRLPADVNLLSLSEAAPGFHARHDARLRIYRYRLSHRKTAFGKPYVYWVKAPLDLDAMQRAAALLQGRHDFWSFCDNAEGHDSTLVEVAFAKIHPSPGASGPTLFRIGASHFLWKMVRRLAGALIEVGTGRLSPDQLGALVAGRFPDPARWTLPPSGLFLEAVVYPGDPPLQEIEPQRPAF